jgi:hypothetical protein
LRGPAVKPRGRVSGGIEHPLFVWTEHGAILTLPAARAAGTPAGRWRLHRGAAAQGAADG